MVNGITKLCKKKKKNTCVELKFCEMPAVSFKHCESISVSGITENGNKKKLLALLIESHSRIVFSGGTPDSVQVFTTIELY